MVLANLIEIIIIIIIIISSSSSSGSSSSSSSIALLLLLLLLLFLLLLLSFVLRVEGDSYKRRDIERKGVEVWHTKLLFNLSGVFS